MQAGHTIRIAAGSVLVGVIVLAIKSYAYYLTGSIALYSDALESVVNVATAAAALIAVRLSARPANETLPYGYHKAEYFSAVLIGALIVIASGSIFREAYLGLRNPAPLDIPFEGLAVNGLAALINAAWCWVLLREGRRSRSPALTADGKHLLTDVLSSVGVLAGVTAAVLTGFDFLDPLLAVLVGLNILWSGWGLIKESVGGLMDVALPSDRLARIRELISANAEGAIEAHDIRTRQAGRMIFIDFHLVVPGQMSVDDAHTICDRIEHRLREEVEHCLITIHVEPENKAKHSGIVVL